MKIISAVLIDDVLTPSEPIPKSAIRIVCAGDNYTVYEEGDELPPDPVFEFADAEQL